VLAVASHEMLASIELRPVEATGPGYIRVRLVPNPDRTGPALHAGPSEIHRASGPAA